MFLHIKKLSLLAAILLSYSVIECGQVVERSEQPSRWDRFSSAISTSAKHAPWVAATGVGLYGLHNILSQGISRENMYAPLLTTGLAAAPFLANYKQPLQQEERATNINRWSYAMPTLGTIGLATLVGGYNNNWLKGALIGTCASIPGMVYAFNLLREHASNRISVSPMSRQTIPSEGGAVGGGQNIISDGDPVSQDLPKEIALQAVGWLLRQDDFKNFVQKLEKRDNPVVETEVAANKEIATDEKELIDMTIKHASKDAQAFGVTVTHQDILEALQTKQEVLKGDLQSKAIERLVIAADHSKLIREKEGQEDEKKEEVKRASRQGNASQRNIAEIENDLKELYDRQREVNKENEAIVIQRPGQNSSQQEKDNFMEEYNLIELERRQVDTAIERLNDEWFKVKIKEIKKRPNVHGWGGIMDNLKKDLQDSRGRLTNEGVSEDDSRMKIISGLLSCVIRKKVPGLPDSFKS